MEAKQDRNVGLVSGWRTGQSGWGTSMNNNLLALDALVQGRFKRFITEMPDTRDLVVSDAFIVRSADELTDNMKAYANQIAVYNDVVLVYYTPKVNYRLWSEEDNCFYIFNGVKWVTDYEDDYGYNLYRRGYYFTCSTPASTADKVVNDNTVIYKLKPGQVIYVNFTNGNSAGLVNLDVNGTGSKPVINSSVSITPQELPVGSYVQLLYDGNQYWIVGLPNDLMHLSGNETITGIKTFSGNTYISGKMFNSGTISSSNLIETSGTFNNSGLMNNTGTIDSTKGDILTKTQIAGDNSSKVANTNFVANAIATCVHLNGDETINGNKTFTGSVSFQGLSLIYVGATAPADTSRIWICTIDDTINYYNGTGWVVIVGRYSDATSKYHS